MPFVVCSKIKIVLHRPVNSAEAEGMKYQNEIVIPSASVEYGLSK
jgi:hypothetical protein